MQGYNGVTINPRPYQRDSLRALWKSMKNYRSNLVVVPTGGGKTIIFSMLTNHYVKNEGKRVLIIAHRAELIEQAGDKLYRSTGIDYAIEKAGSTGHDSFHDVVIASIQSLSMDKRLKRYHKDHFDLVIIDETHRSLAKTYRKVIDYFDSAKIVGVTATPHRGDGRNLGRIFENLAYEYSLKDAIDDGWLTPIVAHTCPVQIDLRDVRVNAGEFSASDVEDAIVGNLISIAREIKARASDRKILLFLPLVKTSKLMAEILTSEGIECRSVDGTMGKEDRASTLEWFRNSDSGTALCNSMLLTEGFDQPDIDCIVVLRPTKSTGLYTQMIGRGTRVVDESINGDGLTAEERKAIIAMSDKKDCLILDFLWLTAKHKLCRPTTLVDIDENILNAVEKVVDNSGGNVSLSDIEEIASSEASRVREESLSRAINEVKGRKAVELNPVLQTLSEIDDEIRNWEPVNSSEIEPMTEAQEFILKNNGITNTEGMGRGYADKLLSVIRSREERGLCSFKQMKTLKRYNIKNPATKTKREASYIIDRISKHWKRK